MAGGDEELRMLFYIYIEKAPAVALEKIVKSAPAVQLQLEFPYGPQGLLGVWGSHERSKLVQLAQLHTQRSYPLPPKKNTPRPTFSISFSRHLALLTPPPPPSNELANQSKRECHQATAAGSKEVNLSSSSLENFSSNI